MRYEFWTWCPWLYVGFFGQLQLADVVYLVPSPEKYSAKYIQIYAVTHSTMNALSRREEETLLKTTKARALKECDALVKSMHQFVPHKSFLIWQHFQVSRTAPLAAQFLWSGHVSRSTRIYKIVCCISEFSTLPLVFGWCDSCVFRSTGPEPMEIVRAEYLRLRKQQMEDAPSEKMPNP